MSEVLRLPNVLIREMETQDIPFVFNSWLKSYANSPTVKFVDRTIYFNEQHKVIERILVKQKTLIACDKDSPDNIFGYICFGELQNVFVVHYLYVKNIDRKLGIARQLLEATKHDFSTVFAFTHFTYAGLAVAEKFNGIFHPYSLINYDMGAPLGGTSISKDRLQQLEVKIEKPD